uniref:Uncharacterized protein n=1 Tax=Setaria viridis TaxID=4556 RepID=A0A4U6UMB4_SETVI|nr:hypothetical protein SEVIR_5G366566v2 [Setaria viridis]
MPSAGGLLGHGLQCSCGWPSPAARSAGGAASGGGCSLLADGECRASANDCSEQRGQPRRHEWRCCGNTSDYNHFFPKNIIAGGPSNRPPIRIISVLAGVHLPVEIPFLLVVAC